MSEDVTSAMLGARITPAHVWEMIDDLDVPRSDAKALLASEVAAMMNALMQQSRALALRESRVVSRERELGDLMFCAQAMIKKMVADRMAEEQKKQNSAIAQLERLVSHIDATRIAENIVFIYKKGGAFSTQRCSLAVAEGVAKKLDEDEGVVVTGVFVEKHMRHATTATGFGYLPERYN